jgi:sphingosine kinase
MPTQLHYIKAHAYRIEPLKNCGNLAVDGEAIPFEKIQVEVHTRLATLLSLHGSYVAGFPSKKSVGESQR